MMRVRFLAIQLEIESTATSAQVDAIVRRAKVAALAAGAAEAEVIPAPRAKRLGRR